MSSAMPDGAGVRSVGSGRIGRRASINGDQTASDADQTLADADQTASDADGSAADRDQANAETDQALSDRDQANSDLDHAGDVGPDDRQAYETTRAERAQVSVERHALR